MSSRSSSKPDAIRIVVADDSPTARRLMVALLESDPEIDVVAEASDGREAVALTRQHRPDLVTMDVHMPKMDGFEATRRIMVESPTPIVIVSASVDIRDVAICMQALQAGALTALSKPPGPLAPDFETSGYKLIRTIKAMSRVKVVRRWPGRPPPAVGPAPALRARASKPSLISGPSRPPRVVAIAASTGGPAAISRVVSELPGSFPLPILVVQHIADGFVGGFASWLATSTALTVKVAAHGEMLAAQTVYVAPDGRHLGVSDRRTVFLSDAPAIGGCRPSATFLFDSVASAFGGDAVAVVLTGMGSDGVEGLRALRAAGAEVLAQDEESSVVFGMPAAAVAAGVADLVLPLGAMASRLLSLVAGNGTDPTVER